MGGLVICSTSRAQSELSHISISGFAYNPVVSYVQAVRSSSPPCALYQQHLSLSIPPALAVAATSMHFTNLALILSDIPVPLFCAIAWICWVVFISRRRRTLPLPPGPTKLPFVGNLLDVPQTRPWVAYAEWSKRYSKAYSQDIAVTRILLISFVDSDVTLYRLVKFTRFLGEHWYHREMSIFDLSISRYFPMRPCFHFLILICTTEYLRPSSSILPMADE